MKRKNAIIGSGIAGIALSIRLALRGEAVTVFESNTTAGGKIAQMQWEGFRFDMGPSLFTLPELVEELFVEAGATPTLPYSQLERITQYFWEDGTQLYAYAEPDHFVEELAQKLNEDAHALRIFLRQSAELYDLTADLFLHRSLHKASTYLNAKALRGILNVHKLDAFRTMHRANARRFRNPKTVQLFDRYATYNGSDPYQAPATLNIIAHLEHNLGAFFPDQGMYAIVRSLQGLAESLGVDFQFGQAVDEILLHPGSRQVSGLRLGKERLSFDRVISNMDIVNTYQKLLPDAAHPKHLLRQPKSSSGLIFYWAIRGTFPELDLHNIFFAQDYAQEFGQLFRENGISDDPTVYLFVSQKHCPQDAPKGHENWFVMINTPPDTGQDWEKLRDRARQSILQKLKKRLDCSDLETRILHEEVLDPQGIAHRTSSLGGSLYGNSSNNPFAAFLRHPNFSSRYPGLFFCGGSVHPGGGIPLCLLSAKITAELMG
ncbi:MAG: 1-hydroxycarotenoid 3,4-desaturase CrtD [Bernardetiaceae bacterium]